MLYWFLDFATHWCASSRIHQNFALQVGFLPSNQIFLSLTSCRWFHAHCPIQLVITGPVIFAGWALGHQNNHETRTLSGSSSKNWVGPSGSLRSTTYYWRIRSLKFSSTFRGHRPSHSYFHVAFGLVMIIIILAQYQVCVAYRLPSQNSL